MTKSKNSSPIRFVILIGLVMIFSISCQEDDSDDVTDAMDLSTLTSKWEFVDNDELYTLEMNEDGNYIAKKKNATGSGTIRFGDYQISDNTVYFESLGELKITSIDDVNLSGEWRSNTENTPIIISGNRSTTISESDSTNLLCKSWQMVSVNGEEVDTEYALTVIWSNAGTYFVEFDEPTDENEGGLSQWKWNENQPNSLLYNWDGTSNWDDADEITIVELSATSLTIREDYSDDESETFVLKPLHNN